MTRTLKLARITCVWTMVLLAARPGAAQDAVLHIKVVAGDGATYTPGAHAAKPLTVEVTDAAGRPVAGAKVSFQVPEEGPGGVFANGLRTDIATTDSSGRATGHGLQLNRVAGSFAIRITAAKEQARAGTIARQSIGEASARTESADRKTPPPVPVRKEPAPAPAAAPQHPAPQPPAVAVPGTTATGPVKVAGQQPPPAETAKTVAQTPHGVPTIIVTQKSSKSITEVGADSGHKSHKKWIWIGLLAAGGAGAAFAGSSMGAGAAHSGAGTGVAAGLSSAVSIGSPTITIGKP